MSLMLDDIALLYLDQLVLEFTPEQRDRAWEATANFKYQDASSRWRAFLNALCVETIVHYFQNDSTFQNTEIKTYPDADEFPYLWQLINGIAITLNQTRLIIIPSEDIETDELRVDQEWVDLPEWVGNYYLASHIDVENCFLRISGFITYEQLSKEGHYDPFDKTYSLEISALTEDLSALWVTWELSPDQAPQVNSLPQISTTELAHFIHSIEYQRANILRLAMPFEHWGNLFINPNWRCLLYSYPEKKQELEHLLAAAPKQPKIIHVTQWFQQVFEAGWQSLEELIDAQSTHQLAYGFRRSHTPEKDVVQGIKFLDLGTDSKNQVALMVKIIPKSEGKLGVRIQLQSINEERYLPPQIKLGLLSRFDQMLQEVQARNNDSMIQLNQFTCKEGGIIQVQVTRGDLILTESLKVAIP
jgi:hypothetical protein